MTTIVDALDRVTREVSLSTPSNWITESGDSYVEIRDDFLLEVVEDLHTRVDWASPIGKQTTISGSGAEDYALPSDFFRLKNDGYSVYETANVRRFAEPIHSDGEWTHLGQVGTGGGGRYYRVKGYEGNYEISLYPNPASGESLTVSYVSDLWKASSGGTAGSAFTDLGDVLLFPRRVIESGIISRWRARKGLDATDAKREYELLVADLANRTNSKRKLDMSDRPRRGPFDIPVPDFIPAS